MLSRPSCELLLCSRISTQRSYVCFFTQFCPLLVWLFLWSCTAHDCSLSRTGWKLAELAMHSPVLLLHLFDLRLWITSEAVMLWCGWMAVQVRAAKMLKLGLLASSS